MDKRTLFAIATLILLGGALASYYFWPHEAQKPETSLAINAPPPAPVPESSVRQIIEAPAVLPALPPLAHSDAFVFDALADLVGNKTLMKLFHSERVIRNIVATIDNLPHQRVPASIMPFDPPAGHFVTEGLEGNLTISPENAIRYTPYVSIAEAIDATKLVELYVRLYPLFQQSYEELGYPKKYFNDQLIATIDDLLDTPDIKDPIKVIQPKYFYQYATPDLEERSIGQKIMIRLGHKNAQIVKKKLLEIKHALSLHMQEIRTVKAS